MSGITKQLFAAIDELDETEESKYSEFDPDDIKAMGPAAVLVEYKGGEYWMPYSHLRKDERDQLFASNWILDQKDLEV